MAISDLIHAISGVDFDTMSPQEMRDRAIMGNELANRQLSTNQGVTTGAGAIGHVLNAIRGNYNRDAANKALAAQTSKLGQSTGTAYGDATSSEAPTGSDKFGRRARIEEEIKRNPQIVNDLYGLTHAEVGNNPDAYEHFLETVFNRSHARGKSLTDTAKDKAYYPEITHSRAAQGVPPALVDKYNIALNNVLNGSNKSGYATGNASGTVGFAGGPGTSQVKDERFGVEGPDLKWAKRMGLGMTDETRRSNRGAPRDVQIAQGAVPSDQVATDSQGNKIYMPPSRRLTPEQIDGIFNNPIVPMEEKFRLLREAWEARKPIEKKSGNDTIMGIPGVSEAVRVPGETTFHNLEGFQIAVKPDGKGGFTSELVASNLPKDAEGNSLSVAGKIMKEVGDIKGQQAAAKTIAEGSGTAAYDTASTSMKAHAAEADTISKRMIALNTLKKIGESDAYDRLVKGKYSGGMLEATKTLSNLFNVPFIGGNQALAIGDFLKSTNANLAASGVKELTNRATQFDFMTYLASVPGLLQSKEGFKSVVDYMLQSEELNKKISDAAMSHQKTGNWKGWMDEREKIIKENAPQLKLRDIDGKMLTLDKLKDAKDARLKEAHNTFFTSKKAGTQNLPMSAQPPASAEPEGEWIKLNNGTEYFRPKAK